MKTRLKLILLLSAIGTVTACNDTAEYADAWSKTVDEGSPSRDVPPERNSPENAIKEGLDGPAALFPASPAHQELALAVSENDIAKIEALAGQGVDLDYIGASGFNVLHIGMRHLDSFTRLLELGANPDVQSDSMSSAVHTSLLQDDIRFLQVALRFGGNPSLVSTFTKETPLLQAIAMNTLTAYDPTRSAPPEKILLLIEAGADLNAPGTFDVTPFQAALMTGQYDVALLLADKDADTTLPDGESLSSESWQKKTSEASELLPEYQRKALAKLRQALSG